MSKMLKAVVLSLCHGEWGCEWAEVDAVIIEYVMADAICPIAEESSELISLHKYHIAFREEPVHQWKLAKHVELFAFFNPSPQHKKHTVCIPLVFSSVEHKQEIFGKSLQ